MEKNERKEFLFYYESRQNPNGDPGFENQPRLLPDGRILVTDVRIKRTIRDYAKKKFGKVLFVDFGDDGNPVKADKRAKEILGETNDFTKLLTETFDVPLFGALVPIPKKGKKDDAESEGAGGASFKVTGPIQFSLGRSVNQPEILNPIISSHFVGKEKGGEQEHGTFGRFYSVDYALIKFQGAINPNNLSEYWSKEKGDKAWKAFQENEKIFFDCLWNGTNELTTRSKYPQRSVFYFEVTYDGVCYNDLDVLVRENENLKSKITELNPAGFDFSRLIKAMEKRKGKIKKVALAACEELEDVARDLSSSLKKTGLEIEWRKC
ncbi:MAG: type I CRISPR-associated protein Cas7 [Candidatus Micrarchaeota archaeon]|nr:type I CRISPR-associated protein Cas7 [Candidatus Micrarchaeota archaeon]